jgi:hypothetical protein
MKIKKQLLFLLITILSLNCYSQITFEKGYYINNSNQKVDCLIKNIDWRKNPTEFEYKLSDKTERKALTINSVKEFGIYNISKYIRDSVNIDRSRTSLNDLSNDKHPIFKKEQLFLKELVGGKANLYLYEDINLKRFFYNKDSFNIKQLIHKGYITSENKIKQNNSFKYQLWNDLRCENITMKEIGKIDYEKNELVNFFVKYNVCNNTEPINYEEKQTKHLFNLTLRPGINYSSLVVENPPSGYYDTDFGSKLGFRFGVEFELIMPFNKNKWAIIFEPTYQFYKSEPEIRIYPNSTVLLRKRYPKVEYKSIELPLGIRQYFFLNNNSKIFINGSFIMDIPINSKIVFENGRELEINSALNLAFGIGYKHNDKYNLELRYQLSRNSFEKESNWSSDYHAISLIFGYTIF